MNVKLIIGNKNYSSWSLRAWLLLREAGIEFEEHRIVLDTPATAEELAHYSDACMVPVLFVDDMKIWDSMAICETVAELWPDKQLWPADMKMRAHARSISNEMHSGFQHLRECMPLNCRAMGRKVSIPDELGDNIDRVIHVWADCHKRYGDLGPWLFGDFSIADAMYAPVVLRFRTYGINLPESAGFFPHRLLESEAMQDWLAASESETEVSEACEVGR